MALACACGPRAALPASDPIPRALSETFPVRVEGAGNDLVLEYAPRRILPANAAWIDFVSELVGPERVVALPPEAFGYSRLSEDPGSWIELPPFPVFEGERILALAPDLVLAHSWQNPETLANLRQAGVPVLVAPVPASWEEILATLRLTGAVLGVPEEARALLAELEARRVALARRAARFARLRALSYTNLGAGGYTSGSGTTGQVLLTLAGVHNAAAEAGLEGDVPADQERLLVLAPDLFLVGRPDRTESSPPSAEYLRTTPALRELEAVRAERIVSLPPALFTSASPELLRGAELLVDELERLWPEPSPPSAR